MSGVNWFPGHMLTAAREIAAVLRLVDVVVEVRDARIPFSSASPLLQSLLPHNMPVVVVLNKADLANSNLSHRALSLVVSSSSSSSSSSSCRSSAVLLSAGGPRRGSGVAALVPACLAAARSSRRGPLHVLVVGVPNAGKSALVNALRRSGHAAPSGPRPGLTRSLSAFAVRAGPQAEPVYVVDTPGVLAPAAHTDGVAGRNLAICGCIKDTAVKPKVVHAWLLQELRNRGKNVDSITLEKVMGTPGNKLDEDSAALQVLSQFREGKLGRYTLDIF